MKSIRLGKTELNVSEIGFGGIPIIPLSFDESVSIVDHCYKQGITFFDTANMYGDSEKKIGSSLEKVRDKVVYATKTLNRDAQGAEKHITYSLNNLKTDTIDIYQFHNISKDSDLDQILGPGGAYESANNAKKEGKIKFIGFSSHDIKTAIKACKTELFATIQFPFNFIENQPADNLFKIARDLDMGIIAMKPLGGGLLERADLCFKFLQQYPDVVPIPGIQSCEEIDEIIALYRNRQPLNQTDQKEIEKIQKELGKNFCHRCGYCMPCDQGVKITDVMSFRSMAKRMDLPIALAILGPNMETVDNCTECGECLDKCPYSLQIPELIREHQTYFKNLAEK